MESHIPFNDSAPPSSESLLFAELILRPDHGYELDRNIFQAIKKEKLDQENYERNLFAILENVLRPPFQDVSSLDGRSQEVQNYILRLSNAVENLIRILVQKRMLPETTLFCTNLYELILRSFDFLCQKNLFNSPYSKEKLSYAISDCLALLLFNPYCKPAIESLIDSCFGVITFKQISADFKNLFVFKILASLFSIAKKAQANLLQVLSEKVRNLLNSSMRFEKSFYHILIQCATKMIKYTVTKDLKVDKAVPWLDCLKQIICLLNGMKENYPQFYTFYFQIILNHLGQGPYTLQTKIQNIKALSNCFAQLVVAVDDPTTLTKINQFLNNFILDNFNLNFLRSDQLLECQERIILRLIDLNVAKLSPQMENLIGKVFSRFYKCLAEESTSVQIVLRKKKICQISQTYNILNSLKGCYPKMMRALKERNTNRQDPHQFLLISLFSLYLQVQYKAEENRSWRFEDLDNTPRQTIMKKGNQIQKSSVEFLERITGNYYEDKYPLSNLEEFFRDPNKLESYYTEILTQAIALKVILTRIPSIFVNRNQVCKKIFLFFFNHISIFPSQTTIEAHRIPLTLEWYNKNVTYYILQMLKFMLLQIDKNLNQYEDRPFFTDLNSEIFISQFVDFDPMTQTSNNPSLLARTEFICQMLIFLVSNFQLSLKFQQSFRLSFCLEKIIRQNQRALENGNKIIYHQKLTNSICRLIVKAIEKNPIEQYLFLNDRVCEQKVENIKVVLRRVIHLNFLNSTRDQSCFVQLLNALLYHYGQKRVFLQNGQNQGVVQNPLHECFRSEMLRLNSEFLEKGSNNYVLMKRSESMDIQLFTNQIDDTSGETMARKPFQLVIRLMEHKHLMGMYLAESSIPSNIIQILDSHGDKFKLGQLAHIQRITIMMIKDAILQQKLDASQDINFVLSLLKYADRIVTHQFGTCDRKEYQAKMLQRKQPQFQHQALYYLSRVIANISVLLRGLSPNTHRLNNVDYKILREKYLQVYEFLNSLRLKLSKITPTPITPETFRILNNLKGLNFYDRTTVFFINAKTLMANVLECRLIILNHWIPELKNRQCSSEYKKEAEILKKSLKQNFCDKLSDIESANFRKEKNVDKVTLSVLNFKQASERLRLVIKEVFRLY